MRELFITLLERVKRKRHRKDLDEQPRLNSADDIVDFLENVHFYRSEKDFEYSGADIYKLSVDRSDLEIIVLFLDEEGDFVNFDSLENATYVQIEVYHYKEEEELMDRLEIYQIDTFMRMKEFWHDIRSYIG